jgi:CrcB protein
LLKYVLIGVGGAFGSMARYWLGRTIANRMGTKFPYGTFTINLVASFLIGFFITFLARRVGGDPAWRFLIPVGFIGAFSTFSTFEWETFSELRNGAFLLALVYALGSIALGLAAVWGGSILGAMAF